MTVQDVINDLKANTSVKYIDVNIEGGSIEGYIVSIEYYKVSRHGIVSPFYRKFLVPGKDLSYDEILNSTEFYDLKVVVNKKYEKIWNLWKKRRWKA